MIEFLLGFVLGALFFFLIWSLTFYLHFKKSRLSLTRLLEKTETRMARKGKSSIARPMIIPLQSDLVEAQNAITEKNAKKGQATPIEDIT